MATGSVPSGTILAVHLQYLLSEKKQRQPNNFFDNLNVDLGCPNDY
jgi:hypothetical protein